jgi:acetyl-CoA carboxylase biotin carboxyl carrier protein
MNPKELKELIEFLVDKDISEFELERGDLKVRLKRGQQPAIAPVAPVVVAAPAPAIAQPMVHIPAVAPTVPQSSPAAAESTPGGAGAPAAPAEADSEAGLHIVRSPIVGTYYESPSPGAPAFAKVGDTVSVGQVLCIVEAMKLMNEIESDVAGEIVKVYASNSQPVEYGQKLFGVRAR